MKRLSRLLAILAALAPMAAFGQGAVLQGGAVTPGRAPMYVQGGNGATTIVQDSGPASGAQSVGVGLSELLRTVRGVGTPPFVGQGSGPLGTNDCNYDAYVGNPTGYHYLCFAPNPGLLVFGAGGTASPLPFTFNINGTPISLPASGAGTGIVTVIIPATSGGVVCFTGTNGQTTPCPGITNAQLATVGAATFKGNPTASAGITPVDFTIQGLTARGAPDANNDRILIYNSSTGTLQYVTPGLIASAATAGVSSLCGLTGALTATQAAACGNIFTSSLQGHVPASGGGTANFLRADGTFAAPPAPSLFSSGAAGTVPASGGGTVNFIRADGTWANPLSPPAVGPYITSVTQTGGSGGVATGRTYLAVPISTAAGNRYIVVADGFRDAGNCPLASMTIGGIAATRVAQNINISANTTITSFWVANVPTGTTATITTVYCGSTDSAEALGVYAIYGLSLGFITSASSTSATAPIMPVAVPAGGIAISVAWALGQTATVTWIDALADYALLSDPTSTSQYQYGASLTNGANARVYNIAAIYGASCGSSECSALTAVFK